MIQFITHATARYGIVEGAVMALQGGCRWIQLRMKDVSDYEVMEKAKILLPLCHEHRAKLIIDDRVELCKAVGADGIHLGRYDMPIKEARAFLGEKYIIGGTANTIEDIRRIVREGGNYIGCGPYRFTYTKKNLSPVLGLEGYRYLINIMKEERLFLPLVAIGGITEEDIVSLMQAGVNGFALSSTILNAENPMEQMKKLITIITQYEKQHEDYLPFVGENIPTGEHLSRTSSGNAEDTAYPDGQS